MTQVGTPLEETKAAYEAALYALGKARKYGAKYPHQQEQAKCDFEIARLKYRMARGVDLDLKWLESELLIEIYHAGIQGQISGLKQAQTLLKWGLVTAHRRPSSDKYYTVIVYRVTDFGHQVALYLLEGGAR